MAAIQIKSPQFSFVYFGTEKILSCCDGPTNVQLPFFADDDLVFQVKIVTQSLADALDVMAGSINDIELWLTDAAGVNNIHNFVVTNTVNFERYHTGLHEVTLLWRNPLIGITTPSAYMVDCDQCFRLKIRASFTIDSVVTQKEITSNVFKRTCKTCFTTLLKYWNDEDYGDFRYCNVTNAFNQVRLFMYPTEPKTPVDKAVYRLSGGAIRKRRSLITKEFTFITSHITEQIHDKLVVALEHDNSEVDSERYTGGIDREGEYEISWTDNLCLAPANFKGVATPFAVRNSSCADCSQSNFNCPSITNLTYTNEFDYTSNDQVFYFSFDPIPIGQAGFINVQYRPAGSSGAWTTIVKSNLQPVGVHVPLGSYDFRLVAVGVMECIPQPSPIVYNVGQTVAPACPMPIGLSVLAHNPYLVTFPKVMPTPIGGYEYEVVGEAGATFIVDSIGTSINVTVNDLPFAGPYTFRVRANCGSGSFSSWNQIELAF